jgi:hypothetical protein
VNTEENMAGLAGSIYPMKFSANALRSKINDPSIQKALRRFEKSEQPATNVSLTWYECVMKELDAAPEEVIQEHHIMYAEARKALAEMDNPSWVRVSTELLKTLLSFIVVRRSVEGVTVPGPDWELLRRLIAMGDTGAVCEAQKAIDGEFGWDKSQWDQLNLGVPENVAISSSSRMEAFMPQREPMRPLSSTADGVYPVRSKFFERGEKA